MKVKIDRSETLRYLGYKGGHIPEDVEQIISECVEKIEEISGARYVYKVFNINEVELEGDDIAEHLEDCHMCILMAATLGMETDDFVRKMQVKDMTKAVILDACGSSAIENVCNQVEAILREEFRYKGMYVTGRFSPGYGDMPLSEQRKLCNLLDTQRKIGVYITGGNTMIPAKSVTAILGISYKMTDKKITCDAETKANCDSCNLAESCAFRKGGTNCGK